MNMTDAASNLAAIVFGQWQLYTSSGYEITFKIISKVGIIFRESKLISKIWEIYYLKIPKFPSLDDEQRHKSWAYI